MATVSAVSDSNPLFRAVSQIESQFVGMPNIKLITPTRRFRAKSLELVEFETVEDPQHRRCRQVFLLKGPFLVHFLLNTDQDDDGPLFDEFLNTVRLN